MSEDHFLVNFYAIVTGGNWYSIFPAELSDGLPILHCPGILPKPSSNDSQRLMRLERRRTFNQQPYARRRHPAKQAFKLTPAHLKVHRPKSD